MIKRFLIGICLLCLCTGCDNILTNGSGTDTNRVILNTNSFADYVPWWTFKSKTPTNIVTNVVYSVQTNGVASVITNK